MVIDYIVNYNQNNRDEVSTGQECDVGVGGGGGGDDGDPQHTLGSGSCKGWSTSQVIISVTK